MSFRYLSKALADIVLSHGICQRLLARHTPHKTVCCLAPKVSHSQRHLLEKRVTEVGSCKTALSVEALVPGRQDDYGSVVLDSVSVDTVANVKYKSYDLVAGRHFAENLSKSDRVFDRVRQLEDVLCLSEVRFSAGECTTSGLLARPECSLVVGSLGKAESRDVAFTGPANYLTSTKWHVLHAGSDDKTSSGGPQKPGPSDGKPTLDQLLNVKNLMLDQIPDIVYRRHEYRIYTSDLIFENNWNLESPKRSVGIGAYVRAVVKVRFYLHANYAKVKVAVLSAVVDEASGNVRVQWRISGLPQIKAFMFWKWIPFRVKATADRESEWLEGLSTFYVNNKGFIYKHVVDRVIPDDGKSADVKVEKGGVDLGTS